MLYRWHSPIRTLLRILSNILSLIILGNTSDAGYFYSGGGGMQVGKLSAGILNMKIDTFDSRNPPSAVTIPGLATETGNPLGLVSGGKSKNAKKKVSAFREG